MQSVTIELGFQQVQELAGTSLLPITNFSLHTNSRSNSNSNTTSPTNHQSFSSNAFDPKFYEDSKDDDRINANGGHGGDDMNGAEEPEPEPEPEPETETEDGDGVQLQAPSRNLFFYFPIDNNHSNNNGNNSRFRAAKPTIEDEDEQVQTGQSVTAWEEKHVSQWLLSFELAVARKKDFPPNRDLIIEAFTSLPEDEQAQQQHHLHNSSSSSHTNSSTSVSSSTPTPRAWNQVFQLVYDRPVSNLDEQQTCLQQLSTIIMEFNRFCQQVSDLLEP